MHRDPRGMMPKASRQFSKEVWIHPVVKIQLWATPSQNPTVTPLQTLHELIELKIHDFYAAMLDTPCPLLNLQPVLLGRTQRPTSQLCKATLFLLKGESSSATEPAKMVCVIQQAASAEILKNTHSFVVNHPSSIENFGPTKNLPESTESHLETLSPIW